MSLADEVRTVRQRVLTRLRELEPLVREYEELLRLAGELGNEVPAGDDPEGSDLGSGDAQPDPDSPTNGEVSGETSATAPPDRPPRASGGGPAGGRGRKGTGGSDAEAERDSRVLDALRDQPGMTTAEL